MGSSMIHRMLIACAITASAARAQGIRPKPLVVDPRAPIAARRLAAHTVFDSTYRRQRRIWVYTPADYDAKTTAYPLIVAFDGANYRDTMPLPWILDTLRAVRKAPAAFAHRGDDRGEVVVEQHHRRGFSRDVSSSPPHGDADVRPM